MPRIAALPIAGPTLPERGVSWAKSLRAAGKAPRTVVSYLETLDKFVRFLHTSGMPLAIDAISKEHLEAFISDQLFRYKPATANVRYRGLPLPKNQPGTVGRVEPVSDHSLPVQDTLDGARAVRALRPEIDLPRTIRDERQ